MPLSHTMTAKDRLKLLVKMREARGGAVVDTLLF